jgi:hypothetical protein
MRQAGVALDRHRLTGMQIQEHNPFQYLATFPNPATEWMALQVSRIRRLFFPLFIASLATLPKSRTGLATFPE